MQVAVPDLSMRVVLPAEARVMRAFGDEMILHLGGVDTGGRFTMWTNVTPPGGGPPPHYHLGEDEWFYPLEGRAEFFADGEWREVPVGTTVFVPKGKVHTFRNAGDTPLRMLVHTSPSGFETFFGRCAEEFARTEAPDMEKLVAISAEHGIYFVG